MDLRREDRASAQPIVDRGDGEAAAHQPERLVDVGAGSALPAAPMNPHHCRERSCDAGRPVEIQHVIGAGGVSLRQRRCRLHTVSRTSCAWEDVHAGLQRGARCGRRQRRRRRWRRRWRWWRWWWRCRWRFRTAAAPAPSHKRDAGKQERASGRRRAARHARVHEATPTTKVLAALICGNGPVTI